MENILFVLVKKDNSFKITVVSMKKELNSYNIFDIAEFIDDIILDIKYATCDNLTGMRLYENEVCYLHIDVIKVMQKIQNELGKQWLWLKVRDWYRPQSVQDILVSHVSDADFTPSVSNHSRWIAIDLTLVDIHTKEEVIMPTKFDDLSTRAYPNNANLSKEIIKNRDTLIKTMEKYWFRVYPYERRHFDYIKLLWLNPLDISI